MRTNVSDLELVQVAHIVKSYNTTGEVIIKLSSDLLEDFDIKEPVFINFDNLPVPFFITSMERRGNSGAIVKFSSVNDFNSAEELIQKSIHISTDNIDQEALLSDKDNMTAFLKDCKVYNQSNTLIGKISDYHDFPNNPCLEVILDKKNAPDQESILIPFNEDLILDFNPKKRVIKMEIPNGLLEL